MKLAMVVPRYGPEVVGGAENAARMLAERLVGVPDVEVEVLTTTALDSLTWSNHYAAGRSTLNGVEIERFDSPLGRHRGFSTFSDRVLACPAAASRDEADHWIDLQGPVCPDLVDAAAGARADVVAFYPYLYYPTVRGLPLVPGPTVMHPAAHDEGAFYLPVFDPVFASCDGFVYHTYEEKRLVQSRFSVAQCPEVVLGLGIEAFAGPRQGAAEILGLGERPYLCCVGRVDDLKGSAMLAEFFAAYKRRHPGPLALALVGPVAVQPIAHPDIILTGPVSESAKWDILEGATALVTPSPYESFSIVMMEAWTAGLPVVVNAACAATLEHCRRSGGGLSFGGYAEFEVVIDRLIANEKMRATLARNGRNYVESYFAWPVLIGRYLEFLGRVLARS
ncbi:MAG: glycosyltransferase family 4 protein [Acidimicrobiales bacterium]